MPLKFKAGKYFVGDPCYAIKDENWKPLLESNNYFNLETTRAWAGKYNGKIMFAAGTAYGDGLYFDNDGRAYGVDAGLLGIIPFEACDGDSMGCGHVIEFSEDFEVWAEEGCFTFGELVIETGEVEENDDFYDDYDDGYCDEDEDEF